MSRQDTVATLVSIQTTTEGSAQAVTIYRCRQEWDQLKQTEHPDVRFCDACARSVFRARDHAGFLQLAASDKCVGVGGRELMVGMAGTPYQSEKTRLWDDE